MARFPHRAVNFSLDVLRAKTESKRVYRRLALLFAATVVATAIGALAMYFFERHAPDSDIKSYGVAVFWTASQTLTLGSALDNPVTTPGRILAVAMDVYAVVVIGTVSGTLGAYFLHRINVRLGVVEVEVVDENDQDQHENEDSP